MSLYTFFLGFAGAKVLKFRHLTKIIFLHRVYSPVCQYENSLSNHSHTGGDGAAVGQQVDEIEARAEAVHLQLEKSSLKTVWPCSVAAIMQTARGRIVFFI